MSCGKSWNSWAGRRLFFPVGLIEVGPPDGVVLPGVIRSARQHGLEIEHLSQSDVRNRFPGFELGDELQAVFEPTAGYLLVEDCVAEHLRLARDAGADYVNVTVRSWSEHANEMVVQSDRGTFRAKRLVICGGAWASQLLGELSLKLRVTAKHMYWCAADQRYHADAGCPTFFYETPAGSFYYGFPQIDSRGLKVAEHGGGVEVDDPSALCREADPLDQARAMEFVARYLPGVKPDVSARSVCMYTMSRDEHFVVDVHPRCDKVVFAAGLSGHGFKFTPVLGESLADLALDGRSSLPIDFLGLRRWES